MKYLDHHYRAAVSEREDMHAEERHGMESCVQVMDCADPALMAAAFRLQGNEAFKKGRNRQAVQLYSMGIRTLPSATLLCNRAETFLKLEEYNGAISDCTEAIQLEPSNWRAFSRRASALQAQGNCMAAAADLQQAKRLCPKNANMFERIRVECKREACENQRSEFLKDLAERVRLRGGFPKGEKAPFLLGQQVMKVEDCIKAIFHHINGERFATTRQDAMQESLLHSNLPHAAAGFTCLSGFPQQESEPPVGLSCVPDAVLVVGKLKELKSVIHKGGKEVREMLAACDGMQVLVAAYPYDNLLVLEILHEACKIAHEQTMYALMRAQPLPTLVTAIRHSPTHIISISCSLLNHLATYHSQQVLTAMIQCNVVPLLLVLMSKASVLVHESIAGLLAKLAADPRLRRHLLSMFESQQTLCKALVRACASDKQSTRLSAAQTIASLVDCERPREEDEWNMGILKTNYDEEISGASYSSKKLLMLSLFASEESGVLDAVARLLARESELAPEEINHPCSYIEDLSMENDSSCPADVAGGDQATAILRDFNRATGYVEIVLLNAVRAIECMAYAGRAVEVVDQIPAWGHLLPLMSSSPPRMARVAAKALAKYCLRSAGVAMKVAGLRPANPIFVALELAQCALRSGDVPTHQAAMILLGELAPSPQFLDTVKNPGPFSLLCAVFVNLHLGSHRVVAAACTCMEVALTNCDECLMFAEQVAPKVARKLVDVWKMQANSVADEDSPPQVEGLLRFLTHHGKTFKQSIATVFGTTTHHGPPLPSFRTSISDVSGSDQEQHAYELRSSSDTNCSFRFKNGPSIGRSDMTRHHSPADPGDATSPTHPDTTTGGCTTDLQRICHYLGTLASPTARFADLWVGAPGLLPVQLAKHLKRAHFYAICCDRCWVSHTRRLARQEAVANVTTVLSTSMDTVGRSLPVPVDVAIVCLPLDSTADDMSKLFHVVSIELLIPQGKLVILYHDPALKARATHEAANKGLHVFQELPADILRDHRVLVLQKSH